MAYSLGHDDLYINRENAKLIACFTPGDLKRLVDKPIYVSVPIAAMLLGTSIDKIREIIGSRNGKHRRISLATICEFTGSHLTVEFLHKFCADIAAGKKYGSSMGAGPTQREYVAKLQKHMRGGV